MNDLSLFKKLVKSRITLSINGREYPALLYKEIEFIRLYLLYIKIYNKTCISVALS